MLFEFKNFTYKLFKHVADEQLDNDNYRRKKYRLRHLMDCLFYLYWLIRAIFLGLMFFDSKTFPFYQYDYGAKYFWIYQNILNKFFIIIVILVILFVLLFIRAFFFHRVDTLSFQILYDCIVFNTDQYWKSIDTKKNIQIKKSRRLKHYRQRFKQNHPFIVKIVPKFIPEKLFKFRVWLDSWLALDQVDRKLFQNQNKMQLFPHASLKCRTNILLFLFGINIFNYILQITVVIVIFIGACIIINQVLAFELLKNSCLFKLSLSIELIIIFYSIIFLLQCGIIITDSIIVTYIIFHNSVRNLNQKFIGILNKCQRNITMFSLRKKILLIQFIFRQHNRLAYYLLSTNQDLWSEIFYSLSLVSIPINIIFMLELIFEDLPQQTRWLFIFLTIIHASPLLICYLSLAKVSYDFHRIKDHIPSMQLQLKYNQHLRIKLKYDNLYERLMFGRKICYTFGYLGNLTFRGLFEGCLVYIMAFFLVIRFYTESKN
ncbi:uncharacterized protein LOC113797016 [Dermatophagoides pteronyssinus]|uniref:uncharacterized protein LOC113797016 n=1 Tax=Dermatophagoides pteronyssinus TaxID=6956 RepID=UPI003F666390